MAEGDYTFSDRPVGPGPTISSLGPQFETMPQAAFGEQSRLQEAAQAANSFDAVAKDYQLGYGLADLAWNRQLAMAKGQADLGEVQSRGDYFEAYARNFDSEAENRKALLPLDIQTKQQNNQLGAYKVQDAKTQMDQRQKALDEYPDWIGAVNNLNPTDPDYNTKLADINAKYPNASNDPATMNQARPFFARHAQIQSQDTTLKRNNEDLNTLTEFQKPENGFIPRNVDIRSEVNAGRAQQWLDYGNQQQAIRRYQNAMPYMDPQERSWAQSEIGRLTGSYTGGDPNVRGPDATMLGHNGMLNPDSNAILGSLERKYNLVPKPAGPTKDVTVKTYDESGNVTGTTTIKGVPATQQDIAGKPAAPGTTAGQAQSPGQMGAAIMGSKAFQAVAGDIVSGKLKAPAGVTMGTPEGNAWLKEQYLSRAQQLNEPVPGSVRPEPLPGTTPSGSPARARAGKISYEPGTSDVLPTSNNDYRFPAGASDVMGIDRNVWANVMSEEGREFGKDGSHDSVFGLWADKAGPEGQAYRVAKAYGPDSPEAYHAVTGAWVQQFLGQSRPWELTSPGLQELVIADSQHQGGEAARRIIDQMGGFDAVNQMDPREAIAQYSELRKPLWPGNNKPFPDGASDRVTRERAWALRMNDRLATGARQVASASPTLGGTRLAENVFGGGAGWWPNLPAEEPGPGRLTPGPAGGMPPPGIQPGANWPEYLPPKPVV